MRASWLLGLVSACHRQEDGPSPSPVDAPVGEGVFAEGCPSEGSAFARSIGVDATLAGAVAVGGRGDFLIGNARSAYVITRPDAGSTYYYYGGILADAAPMDGCTQAADDGLDEVALILGQIEITDFESSILRGFRADSVDVLADGSDGGPAIVRATGTDDMHWLVEYELIRAKAASGGRPLSAPFGLEVTVDYVLEPDSPVLQVEWTLTNPSEVSRSLLTGALLSFAPAYELASAGAAQVDFAGLSMVSMIPYISATDGKGAFAWALEGGNLAYTRIAGIDVAVNLDQALISPLDLPPGGTATSVAALAVGAGGGASATGPLSGTAETSTVTVVDETGAPLVGARVDVWGDGGAGAQLQDIGWTDAQGACPVALPAFSPPWTYTFAASAPGRDAGVPGPSRDLQLGPAGALDVRIEEGGSPVPARIALLRDDGLRVDVWTAGASVEALPPGVWSWTLTRGYEYAPVVGAVEVPPGGSADLHAALARVVDTTGWMSIDTHVHSAHSPDSRMDPPTQVRHAAAHGLDVVLHTEHEHIVEQTDNPERAGVAGFIASVIGQEMTATVPEHMTMFPLVPDGSPRGGPIAWYGKDIATLFDEMHARSEGGINILNHPGYLDLVGWDYVAGVPTLDDPTLIGLAPDAALWSWNLEGIEVMNGHGSPFADGNRRFEKWQSLLNAGHLVFPAGCSDDHGGDETGFPRTYVQSATDDPADLDLDGLVEAMRAGAVSVSAGAFLRVSIDGAGPGSLVTASGTVPLAVEVEAAAIDVTHVVVFANCDEIAQVEATDPLGVVKLDTVIDVPVAGDTQIVVAAFGADDFPLGLPQYDPTTTPRALSGAIRVDADGNGQFDAPGGRICNYDVHR